MDTGEGVFTQFTTDNTRKEREELFEEHPNHGGIFTVGEIVELKGSMFRVKAIKKKELRLKLLPKEPKRVWV